MKEKTILSLFLKTDYRDKEKGSYNKLTGIMISYLFANTFIGLSYYIRFDEFSYAVISLSMNIFFITFIALTEYSDLFFTKKYNEIFNVLPVTPEEIFSAKFKSAMLYISGFIAVLLIPQVIFFALYSESTARTLLFILVNISFTIFVLFVLLLLQSVSVIKSKGKSNKLTMILQFVFIGLILYTSTITSKTDGNITATIKDSDPVYYLPQTYFYLGIDNYLYLLLSTLFTIIAVISFYKFQKRNYELISGYLTVEIIRKKKPSPFKKITDAYQRFIDTYILNNNIEKAFYGLAKDQFKNSKQLKIKNIPFVLLPLIFALIGVVGNQQGFLYFDSSKIKGLSEGFLILGPSITMMIIMSSRLLISGTKIADENSNDTDWIYNVIPVKEKVWIYNGVNKFIYLNFLIPVLVLIYLILLYRIEPLTLTLNILYVVSFIIFINSIFGLFDKVYPFTLENTKHNSSSKFFEVLLTMVLGILVFAIQIFVFKNLYFIIGLCIVLTGISALINRK